MTYEEICDYIYDIPKFTKKNSLKHTKELLAALGNPQRGFEVLHVAGSNGKGSVCAFLNSVLCEAQLKTGMFTSPHLTCMEERFVINGHNCSREDFCEAFEQVKETVDNMAAQSGFAHPTFFEILFVMGMLIFQKNKIRYLVLETGLGGRLDTTNIFEEPLVTIITSISLEHTEILGDTIEQIAAEKAGIIKEGVPVIFDGNDACAAEVITGRARSVHAPYYKVSVENLKILERTGESIDFCFSTGYDNVDLKIPFVAEYQIRNAALAYRALSLLSVELGLYQPQIAEGMAHARWSGRMQQVAEGIYFDGAHNTDGIHAFLDTVRQIGGTHPLLLFSMVCEKDYHKVVELLTKEIDWDGIILTKIPDKRGLEPEVLEQEFLRCGVQAEVIYDWKDAYRIACKKKGGTQKLFCAGSLYLIGELEKLQEDESND